jgi:hypothetical protein
LRSIGDLVWFDSDGMGDQDPGEPGLVEVPVQLIWPGEDGILGGGDDELFLTTTDSFGGYRFENLPPGQYRVDVLGALPTATANTHDEDGGFDSATVVDLALSLTHDTADFGYQGSASIGDTVWWDMDADGDLDVGEPGIAGVEVTAVFAGVDGIFGNADDLFFTATTDDAGSYLFTDLPEGDYEVAVGSGVPAGLIQTYDETGPLDEMSIVTNLLSNEIRLGTDFGYNGTGSIGDYVWLDLNSDGIQDGGEPGIPGADVYLIWYGVDGSEGSPDDVTLSTTTDIDGNYAFFGLPAGSYDVVVNSATLPAGVAATHDADGLATPHFSTLALAAGVEERAQDFGYVGGAEVGDTIWFDRDADGAMSADEYGLGNVAVDLIWAGPDGVFGTADDESFSATTDIDGEYLIGSLPPGQYMTTVDTGTLPSGMAQTFDEDGTLDDETSFTLGDGEAHLSSDFGYAGAGQIGDSVWLDLNADGVIDGGEPGIPGQTIELLWSGPDATLGSADDQLYAAATDTVGVYVFANLPPGNYDVVVTGSITGAALNTKDEDGDGDSHTTISLGDGENHLSADFGYVGSAQIGDLVWLDLDGDGATDAGEPGLESVEVTVTWYGSDGAPDGGDDVTLPGYNTDGTGNYLATGLPDGEYGAEVTAGVPAGLVNSADEDGDRDAKTNVSGLAAGTSHLTADFGYTGSGSIGGALWWDLNGDGAPDPGEPGLFDTSVALSWAGFDGVSGTLDDVNVDTASDDTGNYVFEHLAPGDYRILVDETGLPTGVTQSGDPDAIADGTAALTLGVAENSLNQDFGYRGKGSVGDFVWYDVNNDGIQDPDEPGVPAVTIAITYLGQDGARGGGDDVAFAAETGPDGHYTLPGMPSGFYGAVLAETTLPSGLLAATDLDGADPLSTQFTLGAAENMELVDYAVIGDAAVSGTVWNDRNNNEAMDLAEVGVAGIVITIAWQGPSGEVTVASETDAFGTWEASNLPPGNYIVEIEPSSLPLGMTTTTTTSYSLALTPGTAATVDFGLAFLLDVGSSIWIDSDGDGEVDEGEAGIPEVLVNLYDELGQLVDIAATDEAGHYLFEDLLPGLYLVQIAPDTLPGHLLPTWDRDGSADLNTLVDLTSGADIMNANFGFQTGLPVTGFNLAWFTLWGALLTMGGISLATAAAMRQRSWPSHQ